MVSPHESACLRQLYAAGAHVEALARAVGRDPRTVQTALRREDVRLRRDPPLPRDWRAGLPADTVHAIETHLLQLQTLQHVTWQRLRQMALEVTAAAFVFPTPEAYAATLQTVGPMESVITLARRLSAPFQK